MRRSSLLSSLVFVLPLIVTGPVLAVSKDVNPRANQIQPLRQDQTARPVMNRLELAYHALARIFAQHFCVLKQEP
ncbi:MAG: hypothetical protein HOE62_18825 [Alphaproteobacteria bacterium]|jgi:hypothetical protein|nr:hypothetical protein [Alphaproteobacteria bacterium]MBT4020015.1 hypothetical protein [Alphaproteobacteria bacterium]MBT5161297.1 hypothetical protein [Alphaproteobacteria bacterium]MBT5917352.1 hypothetical protein [Alphaproteobacteria bacterium]MBT6387557.1 hypothetical protein [Alphaproteobacteria bacterium]